jgi:hypothetical protein
MSMVMCLKDSGKTIKPTAMVSMCI